jgi:flavin reductase (DIM6/NTAB) family NADH-FMN oxidoreductase RutF
MKPESPSAVLRSIVWPICLVGAKHKDFHNVMTVAWINQVSVNPLLIVISIAPNRFTHDMISKTGEFVVSILNSEQKDISSFCGFRSGRDTDKIAQLNLKTTPSSIVKVPRLIDCLANLECKVTAQHSAGDHTLFIGEVVAADITEENLQPLVMYQGKTITFP